MKGLRDDDGLELDEPPTDEELEAARLLRDALDGRGEHPDAELAASLRCAVNPSELPTLEHQAILNRALQKVPARRRGMGAGVAGAAAALALAAATALLLSRTLLPSPGEPEGGSALAPASLVRSRTTQPLFGEPFPREGGSTSRIDRIAGARGRDYRTNRFERMGVR